MTGEHTWEARVCRVVREEVWRLPVCHACTPRNAVSVWMRLRAMAIRGGRCKGASSGAQLNWT